MTILVTGGSGFIGSALCKKLGRERRATRCALRSIRSQEGTTEQVVISGLSLKTDWTEALKNVDQVVHLAAQVQIMSHKGCSQQTEFSSVNVEGTRALAAQAAAAGVKRFIFLSSIKVNGELTQPGKPFTTEDIPSPEDAYGISKHEAENALLEISLKSHMEVVIIRPPLVYGPGVKGNFANLVKWVKRGIPLPLASIHNRRSLIAIENLVDFIALCADREQSPRAANQVFLISDGEDVSTSELLHKVARAYHIAPRLMRVPENWLRATARLIGKGAEAERLLGSLLVDSSKARELLGWHPVITMDEQLKKMALHDSAA